MSRDIHISSERLLFTPVNSSYCTSEYVNWLNDDEVVRYLEIFEPYTSEKLYKYLLSAEQNDQLLFWAIHIKATNKHIGNIKIDPVNYHHGYAEYGIMMGDKKEWGKQYATEASNRIIEYCFEKLGLRKITLGVVEDNIAAFNLYRKLGFEVEGVLKEHGFYNGHLCNMVRMAKFNTNEKNK